mmetsp:Transcript_10867/g.25920  ORF Transcript_10867/g.25920 Transcript_10867/m.25920 type:complete len:216 (+) Transcript_10867:500-1147(+)
MTILFAISIAPCCSAAISQVLASVGSSVTTTIGIVKVKEMMFITPYTFAASIFFDVSLFNDFVVELPSLPLRAAAAFARDAYKKAWTLISTPFPSFTQASPTPPTIGINMAYASGGLMSIGGTRTPTNAAKTGSHAFTICANDTAPTALARTVPQWARHANNPMGIHDAISSAVRFGVFRIPVNHITDEMRTPTANCADATNQSALPIIFNACLL